MRSKVLEVVFSVAATPSQVYTAWMSSKQHAAMTGGEAEVDASEGGKFSAWDGYIQGETLEFERGRRVLQSWRTADFAKRDADSQIEVLFEAAGKGTRVTINHRGLSAAARRKYDTGWQDFYVKPMQSYFKARAKKRGG